MPRTRSGAVLLLTTLVLALFTITPTIAQEDATPSPTVLATFPNGVNVRSGPGVDFPQIDVLPSGTRVEVIAVSEDGEWYRIARRQESWVLASLAVLEPPGATLPSVPGEIAPADPAGGGPIQATPLNLTPRVTTVFGQPTVTPTPTPSVPIATFQGTVNARSGPGLEYDIIGEFDAGDQTEVLAISIDGQWFRVRLDNRDAWVFSSLVLVAGDTRRLPREAGVVEPGAEMDLPAVTPMTLTPTPETFRAVPTAAFSGTVSVFLTPDRPAGSYTRAELEDAARTIENRLLNLGVITAATVQGSDTIVVDLSDDGAGTTDLLPVMQMEGRFEVVDLSDVSLPERRLLLGATIETGTRNSVAFERIAGGEQVVFAAAQEIGGLSSLVTILDSTGADALRRFTEANVNQLIGLTVDGQVIAAPLVDAPISNGRIVLTPFDPQVITERRLEQIAAALNGGPLPFPLLVQRIDAAAG
jgi:uncharacterized protein YraI